VPPGADSQADLDTILSRVPALAGTPRAVAELPGGLTNRNYKVTTPGGSFVARVWSRGDLLAINRDHEYHNSVAAAQAGVGAEVLAYHPDDSLLVLRYIDGRTYGNADVCEPANIGRIALACRRLHGGPRFRGEFNVFANQRRYRSVARDHRFAIPAGYDELMPRVEDARKALAVRETGTVPCQVRLDAVGGDPARDQPARLRLLGLGHGAPRVGNATPN
jgi:hypothetical protein